jgi:glycosyltransferase involved in cell wall biosynthesis
MVAARLAAAQAALGHEVTLLSYAEPGRQGEREAALGEVPHLDRCRIELLPAPRSKLEWVTARSAQVRVAELLCALTSFDRRAAVLHLHGVWEPTLMRAAAAARRAGAAYVVRPAGMLDTWSLAQKKWKKKLALALGCREMLHGALFLHALNADEKRLVEPLRLACPVEVIPNGVFLEELDAPAPGTFRKRYPQLGDRPFVLFLGRLHTKKGLDHLADAFALLADTHPTAHLVVAGPDDGAEADFRQRVSTAGLASRVHLVGPLYGRDKLAAMADANVFCLPSRQEGFSVAVTEALACGLPAVVSRACHFPEVADAGAGEVVELDAHAIAAALARVLANPAVRTRMAQAGRELIASRFTWQRIAAQTVEAYVRRMGFSGSPHSSTGSSAARSFRETPRYRTESDHAGR